MIGLDTNIIVRALTNDDPVQSPAAQGLLRSLSPEEPGYVTLIALVEVVWVLRQTYGYQRELLLDVVEKLLGSAELMIEQADRVRDAVTQARAVNRELPDVLIALGSSQAGCRKTYTFDRRATNIPGMVMLPVTEIEPPSGEA